MRTFLASAFYTLAALVALLVIAYIVDDFSVAPPAFIKSEMVQDCQEVIIVLCLLTLGLYCFLRGAFILLRHKKPITTGETTVMTDQEKRAYVDRIYAIWLQHPEFSFGKLLAQARGFIGWFSLDTVRDDWLLNALENVFKTDEDKQP